MHFALVAAFVVKSVDHSSDEVPWIISIDNQLPVLHAFDQFDQALPLLLQ